MKNKTEFKVGDKVILTNPEPGDWGRWAKEECSTGIFTVAGVTESGDFFGLEGCSFTHMVSQFEIMPDALTIILRRPADRKSIEKFLRKNDYIWMGSTDYGNKEASRIIQVHLTGGMIMKTQQRRLLSTPLIF